jgi:thioredoxin 1
VLYFRSDRCAPCTTQGRVLQQIEEEFAGQVSIQQIDADLEREKAASYGVFTLPTTLIVDPTGQVTHVNYGLTDAGKLTQQLQSIEAG